MKPIATTLTAQPSVDLAGGQECRRSTSAPISVPCRAVPILEAMLAFTLAQALLEKLGGNSMDEIKPRFAALRQPRLGDLKMDGDAHVFRPRSSVEHWRENLHLRPAWLGKSAAGRHGKRTGLALL